jgi:hypothetical protein
LAVPFNWLLWRAFSAKKDWWTTWVKLEVGHHGVTYALLALWAAMGIGVIGYLLGWRQDE